MDNENSFDINTESDTESRARELSDYLYLEARRYDSSLSMRGEA